MISKTIHQDELKYNKNHAIYMKSYLYRSLFEEISFDLEFNEKTSHVMN